MCTGTWSCSATRHVTRLCYVRQQWDWCATAHWENWSVGYATISETCLPANCFPLVTGFEDLLSLSSSQAWSYSSWKKKICPPSVHSHTHIVYPHLWPISLLGTWWLSNFGCIKYVCYICLLNNLSLCLSVSLSPPPPTTTPTTCFPSLSQSLHMSVSLSISLNSWHFIFDILLVFWLFTPRAWCINMLHLNIIPLPS